MRVVVAVKKCGSRSRNAGYMLQDAGQLEQNAVTHLRLSKLRVAVAGREMRIASREMRVAIAKCEGLGNSMAYLCTFVTSLSEVVLTLYLAWCLFRIIDISHIPHCYGN